MKCLKQGIAVLRQTCYFALTVRRQLLSHSQCNGDESPVSSAVLRFNSKNADCSICQSALGNQADFAAKQGLEELFFLHCSEAFACAKTLVMGAEGLVAKTRRAAISS